MSAKNRYPKLSKISKEQIMLVAGLSLILILLPGCARNLADSFCYLYSPVYTNASDTEDTKYQVDQNNVVWEELCK